MRQLISTILILLCITVGGQALAADITVVGFGDSITNGWPYLKYPPGDGCHLCGEYEPRLEDLLNANGWNAEVLNYGWSGETTTEGLARLQDVLDASNPDYVLIMEGTNDMNDISHPPLRSPSYIVDNLFAMIDLVVAQGAVPIIATLTPDTSYPKDIDGVNELIRSTAIVRNVMLADQYNGVVDNWEALTTDGVHPNYDGYQVLAETWFTAMEIAKPEAELDYVVVEGLIAVNENDAADYNVRAYYTNGSSQLVEPVWSINCPLLAEISAAGLLTTYEVSQDESCTIMASYEESGFAEAAELILTIRDDVATPAEIIIDNGDLETSSTGTWKASGGVDYYGTKSIYSKTLDGTYRYETPLTGQYDLSLWWTEWSSRCTNVPVRIYDGSTLIDTLTVSQQANGGQWNLQGSYTFTGTGAVVIVSQGSACSTNADAVRFVGGSLSELQSIAIEGDSIVNENSASDFNALATFSDGSTRLVEPVWDITCQTIADISATGLLTSYEVDQDATCAVEASYEENGIIRSDTFNITIRDFANTSINFNQVETVGYSNQDRVGTVTVEDSGATLAFTGNRWVKTVQYYDITQETVIEFDFKSTIEGEIHGIGFDEDDVLTNDKRIIEFYGTSLWSKAIQNDQRYQESDLGNWIHFVIPVGHYYSGNNMNFVLVNDHDYAPANGTGWFRNVEVYEVDVVPSPVEIIIDNGDPETSSTGTWQASGGADYYGTKSIYSKTVDGTYRYEADLNGQYELSLWWTEWSSRCTNVPVRIYDGSTLIDALTINQQENGGQWNLQGSYTFTGTGAVVIVSQGTACSTNADAVRLSEVP